MTLQDGVMDAVVLIVCLVAIACAYVLARRWLSSHEQVLQLTEREQQLTIRECEAAFALTEATAPQRAELEQAQLLRQAAEARVIATLADDPRIVDARTGEELEVITARKAARVEYAREHGAEENDVARVDALMVGYNASIRVSYHTYDSWFGNADLSGLSISAIEALIASYVQSIQSSYHTFASWYGRINPRAFQ